MSLDAYYDGEIERFLDPAQQPDAQRKHLRGWSPQDIADALNVRLSALQVFMGWPQWQTIPVIDHTRSIGGDA